MGMLQKSVRFAATVVLLLATLACSSGPTTNLKLGSRDISLVQTGTQRDLIPIDSDNLSMAGYDSKTRVMTVVFDNQYKYEYYDVPLGLWEDFLAPQPHPWSQVGYPRLVGEGFGYKRLR
jgi:hypothetical protein